MATTLALAILDTTPPIIVLDVGATLAVAVLD
jgi:hypothetical protein